jgi:hypothetical protein
MLRWTPKAKPRHVVRGFAGLTRRGTVLGGIDCLIQANNVPGSTEFLFRKKKTPPEGGAGLSKRRKQRELVVDVWNAVVQQRSEFCRGASPIALVGD